MSRQPGAAGTPPRPPLRRADGLVARPAVELAALVRDGSVPATAVVRAHLDRIRTHDGHLQALTRVASERALADAADVDRAVARGEDPGPLAGLPVVVKDNVDVAGEVTACGSRAHRGDAADRDAPVVDRLRAAGAVVLGRATMDELAMGAATTTAATGAAFNPWQRAHSPGGSSGGCAAAVAAGMAPLAVGTDTGGSIREPASQCGVTGIAPTPGLVPAAGVVPFAATFDRVGPIARGPGDAALALAVMAGLAAPGPAPPDAAPADLSRLRVGVVGDLTGAPNRPGVLAVHAEVLRRLRELGAETVDVSLPDARIALRAYSTLTAVESLEVLAAWVSTGRAGEEVQRRHHLGRALRADRERVAEAEEVRHRLSWQVADALDQCDLLLSPTMPTTAPRLDRVASRVLADPLSAPYTDCWTVVANLARIPAVSLPAGTAPDDRLPVGAMLSGAPGSDLRLLEVAGALARPLPW